MSIVAIVTVAGALTYGFASNSKLEEIGRLTFFVGALWLVHELAGGRLHF